MCLHSWGNNLAADYIWFLSAFRLRLNILLNVHLSCSTGPFNGNSGINKSDTGALSASSNSRSIPKKESEKVSLTRESADGMNRERLVAKANNKYVVIVFSILGQSC